MDEANMKIRKLETTNVDLSRFVKRHEMRIILMKEKRDDLQRAKAQVTAIRLKYYKETGELQHQVNQLREQLRDVNERQPQHTERTETEHHRSSRVQHHRSSRDEHHSTSRAEHHRTSRAEHHRTSRAEHHHELNQRHVPLLRSQVNRLA